MIMMQGDGKGTAGAGSMQEWWNSDAGYLHQDG